MLRKLNFKKNSTLVAVVALDPRRQSGSVARHNQQNRK